MLLLTKLKGHRSNFHYSGPQKAQLVDPEFKIQVTRIKVFKTYKLEFEHPVCQWSVIRFYGRLGRYFILTHAHNQFSCAPQILADHLTLYQPGGTLCLPHYYVPPPPRIFRPCDRLA
jgi:hypothetical protein